MRTMSILTIAALSTGCCVDTPEWGDPIALDVSDIVGEEDQSNNGSYEPRTYTVSADGLTVTVIHDREEEQTGEWISTLHFTITAEHKATVLKLPLHVYKNHYEWLECTEALTGSFLLWEMTDGEHFTPEWSFGDYLGTNCGDTSNGLLGYAYLNMQMKFEAGETREFLVFVNGTDAVAGDQIRLSIVAGDVDPFRLMWADASGEHSFADQVGFTTQTMGQLINAYLSY